MIPRRACLRILLALLAAAPARGLHAAAFATMKDNAYGVLLLGDGGDRDWMKTLADISKKLSAQCPFEFAEGQADVKAIQKSVDRLAARHAKKIVVVPLYTTSNSDLMDQTRYLFGIRENPSEPFFLAGNARSGYSIIRRVQTKVPVVLTQALDDHPLVVEILASRALALSRRAANENLVLVGVSPSSGTAAAEYRQTLNALAERVRAKGGFKASQSAVLEPSARQQSVRESREREFYNIVHSLSRTGHVLIVPHAVAGGALSRPVLKALKGTFMRYQDKGLIPDDRIVRWVEETAAAAAKLPDMKVYKDAGRPLKPAGKALRVPLQEIK